MPEQESTEGASDGPTEPLAPVPGVVAVSEVPSTWVDPGSEPPVPPRDASPAAPVAPLPPESSGSWVADGGALLDDDDEAGSPFVEDFEEWDDDLPVRSDRGLVLAMVGFAALIVLGAGCAGLVVSSGVLAGGAAVLGEVEAPAPVEVPRVIVEPQTVEPSPVEPAPPDAVEGSVAPAVGEPAAAEPAAEPAPAEPVAPPRPAPVAPRPAPAPPRPAKAARPRPAAPAEPVPVPVPGPVPTSVWGPLPEPAPVSAPQPVPGAPAPSPSGSPWDEPQ